MTGCLILRASHVPEPSPFISLVVLLPSCAVSPSKRLRISRMSVWPLVAFACSPNRQKSFFRDERRHCSLQQRQELGLPCCQEKGCEAKPRGASPQTARTGWCGTTPGKWHKIQRREVNGGEGYLSARWLSAPPFLRPALGWCLAVSRTPRAVQGAPDHPPQPGHWLFSTA